MPYPPNFPTMEGEPMRVQPSRARKTQSPVRGTSGKLRLEGGSGEPPLSP